MKVKRAQSDLIFIFASIWFPTQTFQNQRRKSLVHVFVFIPFGLLARFYADDAHLTRAVAAVLRLHPQLLVAVDQAVGAAGPLAVAALQLGEPRLCVVQLQTSTRSLERLDHVEDPRAQQGGPLQPLWAGVSDECVTKLLQPLWVILSKFFNQYSLLPSGGGHRHICGNSLSNIQQCSTNNYN